MEIAESRKHCFLVPARQKRERQKKQPFLYDAGVNVAGINSESGTNSKAMRQCSPIFRDFSKCNLTTIRR